MNIDEVINGWTFDETINTAENLMKVEKNVFKWDVIRHLRDFAENYRKRLKEYQRLEEQGRLIKLPCKIGDTIYEIHYTNRQYVIHSHVVSRFVIMPYRFPRVEIYFENENGFSTSDFLGQLNEDLFLTRTEAEAKLKELRGNNEKSEK